jgi:hypothetical protein
MKWFATVKKIKRRFVKKCPANDYHKMTDTEDAEWWKRHEEQVIEYNKHPDIETFIEQHVDMLVHIPPVQRERFLWLAELVTSHDDFKRLISTDQNLIDLMYSEPEGNA